MMISRKMENGVAEANVVPEDFYPRLTAPAAHSLSLHAVYGMHPWGAPISFMCPSGTR